ncbi:HNH endonuclease [Microbacterium hatanonis]|uniref:HNH endonuclease n=1 Tax=Microbacterium hatanonis TaxID=404366 RepID=UPI001FEC4F7C|nr:HNH endonuclease [Microbacterium hatanonis]
MRTLVLNAGYEPLAVVSFKRALVLVMSDKATVVEHVEGEPVWGSTGHWDRPAVIVLSRYVRVPGARRVPVTRRGVLRRDAHRCAYCGKAASTIDHVMPRSRGGKDTWENLVACCLFSEPVPSSRRAEPCRDADVTSRAHTFRSPRLRSEPIFGSSAASEASTYSTHLVRRTRPRDQLAGSVFPEAVR